MVAVIYERGGGVPGEVAKFTDMISYLERNNESKKLKRFAEFP